VAKLRLDRRLKAYRVGLEVLRSPSRIDLSSAGDAYQEQRDVPLLLASIDRVRGLR